jgi:hypothetical protein
VAVLFVAAPLMELKAPVVRALPRRIVPSLTAAYRPDSIGPTYSRLFAGVPRTSVTMATIYAGWEVPTYGGRIVAAQHPQAFIADATRREHDVETFFDPATGETTRRRLLCRYGAGYVLVDSLEEGVTPAALHDLGRTVHVVGPYVLLAVSNRCS